MVHGDRAGDRGSWVLWSIDARRADLEGTHGGMDHDITRFDLGQSGEKIHEKIIKHRCKLCEKGFFLKNSCLQHEATHTGEKKFGCDICDRKFLLKSQLTLHTRIHTGDKPFQCIQCKKSFASQSSLKTHLFVHYKEKKTLSLPILQQEFWSKTVSATP